MKKKNLLSIFFLILLLSFCCKQNVNPFTKSEGQNIIFFGGDSILSKENYFNLLEDKKGDVILEKQNKEYLKEYSNMKDGEFVSMSQNKPSIRFVKENQPDKSNIKINLFTIIDNKKIDSVQFYRNISGNEFGKYNCLSYFNPKTNKIWQIKYFPVNPLRGNSGGIVSYKVSSINSSGIIKTDSLYYLDESLDVEVDKYHLYY